MTRPMDPNESGEWIALDSEESIAAAVGKRGILNAPAVINMVDTHPCHGHQVVFSRFDSQAVTRTFVTTDDGESHGIDLIDRGNVRLRVIPEVTPTIRDPHCPLEHLGPCTHEPYVIPEAQADAGACHSPNIQGDAAYLRSLACNIDSWDVDDVDRLMKIADSIDQAKPSRSRGPRDVSIPASAVRKGDLVKGDRAYHLIGYVFHNFNLTEDGTNLAEVTFGVNGGFKCERVPPCEAVIVLRFEAEGT